MVLYIVFQIIFSKSKKQKLKFIVPNTCFTTTSVLDTYGTYVYSDLLV